MRRGTGLVVSCLAVVTIGAPPAVAANVAKAPTTVVITVSPNGTDTTCSAASPCSLAQAQRLERRDARTVDENIDVQLDGGTYLLHHPFRLTAADSGRRGNTVTYRAAAGAQPVLSGARSITGWQRVANTANTWVARIPRGFDTRQLYLDGRRLPLASGMPRGVGFVQTPNGFLMTSAAMSRWPHPSNLQVVFRGGNGPWTQTACPVASIQGHNIRVAEPCWKNMHLKAAGVQELAWEDDPMGGFGGLSPTKGPTKFENAYPLLSPGNWTIDHIAHRIYYDAPKGQSPTAQRIIAPGVQTLLSVVGTRAHPAQNITVEGITFAYAGWTATDDRNGFPQMQADWYLTGANANNHQGTCGFSTPRGTCPFASWTRTPANVVAKHTRHVSFVGNTFRHLGAVGLDVYDGSVHDLVEGNEFHDISGSAIQLGSTNDPNTKHSRPALERYNTIRDNDIHDVAIQYLGGVGIWLGYTQHSLIAHNQIDHVPYTGISIGWGGWHANVLDDNDPNLNAHNVISRNLLYDYMMKLGDGGAIYSNGSQALSWPTALAIHGNVAYNGKNTDFSLYTDAASQYVRLSRNFIYFQPLDSFNSGGCRTVGHIQLFDNYFAPGGPVYPCNAYTDITHWNNNTVCENPPPTQTPPSIVHNAGLQPAYRYLVQRVRPAVNLVGPTNIASKGDEVVISGSGFTRDSVVRFGEQRATKTRVVSANYIFATAPRGNGPANVTVTTAHGTSPITKRTHVVYSAHPSPCLDYTGTGLTTKLFTG